MSLAQLVKFNDQRLSDAEVSDLLDDAPLMAAINAVAASNGTNHRYKKQTTASSSSFRAIDAGVTKTKAADTQVDIVLKVLDGSFSVDVAEADGYRGGRDAYLDIELMRTMKQAMFNTERQLFYGNASPGDTGGFAGLITDTTNGGTGFLDAVADDMVYNASGSTSNAQTSVYLIRSGDDDVSYVAGNDGNITFNTEEAQIVPIYDTTAANGTSYPAYYVPVTGWGCVQWGSKYSAARIANVHPSDTGANLDDALIAEALSLFPSARQPNMCVMNRSALKQLQQSRTTYSPTGQPAPFPTEVFGIPIIVTDALVSTEAVVS